MKAKLSALFLALLFSLSLASCAPDAAGESQVPTPTQTQTLSPSPTESPTEAPAETPTESPAESPAGVPALTEGQTESPAQTPAPGFSLADVPAYSGASYVEINGNVPYFTVSDLTEDPFETYSSLDDLGRCGVAYANICQELMPTEERGEIGMVKPSGWHTVRYNGVVDGNYLYNRCHLIGYQLSGENANEENLITGTRYLNAEGMLPFENLVDDYVDETGNHVLYRVTPVFEGDDLLASGVLMEALSVEDGGEGLSFCVYCYNVQPGVVIDYATGESYLDGSLPAATPSPTPTATPIATPTAEPTPEVTEAQPQSPTVYITPTGKRYHYSDSCNGGTYIPSTLDEALARGLTPCQKCVE